MRQNEDKEREKMWENGGGSGVYGGEENSRWNKEKKEIAGEKKEKVF